MGEPGRHDPDTGPAAGAGAAVATEGDADLEFDVAVVGAGPAGLAAAASAAEAGRSVVVIDESMRPGGQIWRHTRRQALPWHARRWLERLDRSGARLLAGASVVDILPGFALLLQQGGGEARWVSAGSIVLATGARERFLPFPDWTLPGVVGVGGAQALLKSGVRFAGMRVVVAGSGPLLLPVAAALAKAGATIALVAEQAPRRRVLRFAAELWRAPGRLGQAARYRAGFLGTPYRFGAWVTRAAGDSSVREVALTDGVRSWTEACDLLCTGYGLVANSELARHVGCGLAAGSVTVDPWQRTTVENVFCAGEPTGIAGLEAALIEGQIAGLSAAGRRREAARQFGARERARRFAARLDRAFALRDELRALPDPHTVVCRCEDVAFGRLHPEWSSRQCKLYTRAGMGPCQGRVCGPALEFLFGWTADSVRMPVVTAAVGTLAQYPRSPNST